MPNPFARPPHVPGRRWRLARTALLPSAVLAGLAGQAQVRAQAQNPNDPQAAAPVALPAIEVQAQRAGMLSDTQGFVSHRDSTGSKTDTPLSEIPQSVSVTHQLAGLFIGGLGSLTQLGWEVPGPLALRLGLAVPAVWLLAQPLLLLELPDAAARGLGVPVALSGSAAWPWRWRWRGAWSAW